MVGGRFNLKNRSSSKIHRGLHSCATIQRLWTTRNLLTFVGCSRSNDNIYESFKSRGEKKNYTYIINVFFSSSTGDCLGVSVTFIFIRFTRKQSSMQFSESFTRPAGDQTDDKKKKKNRETNSQWFFFLICFISSSPPPPPLTADSYKIIGSPVQNRCMRHIYIICSPRSDFTALWVHVQYYCARIVMYLLHCR